MVTKIFFECSFNSAHHLPHVPDGHKCKRLHGHTYRVRIICGGEVGPDGFVVDYDVVRKAWGQLFPLLDHVTLNDVPGLSNPTCEVIAEWIACAMAPAVKPAHVVEVEVRETESCGAIVAFGSAGAPIRD